MVRIIPGSTYSFIVGVSNAQCLSAHTHTPRVINYEMSSLLARAQISQAGDKKHRRGEPCFGSCISHGDTSVSSKNFLKYSIKLTVCPNFVVVISHLGPHRMWATRCSGVSHEV